MDRTEARERWDMVHSMRRAGKRPGEIAAAMGVSRQRIGQILAKPRPSLVVEPVTEEWKLDDLHQDLAAIRAIATRLGALGIVSIVDGIEQYLPR